jgi:trigger factor
MSTVVREEIDNLNAVLTITLDKAEMENKLKAELTKYRDKGQMKGFRKGKMPETMLRKLYGKALLADIVNDLLQRKLYDHILENKLEVLGQPLPCENHPDVDLDPLEVKDYVFKFDLGVAPEFEIKGLDADSEYEKYSVEISDQRVSEELQNIRKRFGKRIVSEAEIQEEDMIKFQLAELDGDAVKEEGIQHNFSLLLANAEDGAKAILLSHKVGDTLKMDIYALEKDRDEAFARRYFLGLEKEDERELSSSVFQLTIEEASRIEAAELNEEFYNTYFGEGVVSNEEEAREAVRKDYGQYFEQQANALLFRDMQQKLLEENPLPLPEAFLKRWILNSNENATAESVEKGFDNFAKSLRWSLIRNKATRQFNIEVTDEDLHQFFAQRVLSYFGGQLNDMNLISSMVDRLMQDEKQVEQAEEGVLLDKLQVAMSKVVSTKLKPIEEDAFLELVRQIQAQAQAEQAEVDALEPTLEEE